MKAAETHGTTTSSFLQHLRHTVSEFFLIKLRDEATSFADGAFGIQEAKDDLEAAGPLEAEEEEEEETNALKFLQHNFSRAARSSIGEKALVVMPTFPATLYFTLPGLLCLAQIKWQLAPHGFPSPALHKWYTVCVTSLFTEFVASIAQWVISAAGNPTSVYNIIAWLARMACYFPFLGHRESRIQKLTQVTQPQDVHPDL